ncbi:MAG: hypothetical protein ABH834_05120 [Candidatus Altiarchaeota archaeon]
MAEPEDTKPGVDGDEPEDAESRYLGHILGAVILLGVAASILTFFFMKERFLSTVAIFLGLGMGVVAAFYYHASFSAEGRELALGPDEHVILETTHGNSYVVVPSVEGGLMGNNPPLKVNLFLTNKGIVAEPLEVQEFDDEGRLYYFQINHDDIKRIAHESNFMSEYIRLGYTSPSMEEKEILIFAGKDTQKWIDELTNLLELEVV